MKIAIHAITVAITAQWRLQLFILMTLLQATVVTSNSATVTDSRYISNGNEPTAKAKDRN